MATDKRGHTVPAATDHPKRADLTALSLSMGDIVPVANTTARGQLVTDLNALSLGPTTARPLVVARADARSDHMLEITTDGSTWQSIPLSTGLLSYVPLITATSGGLTLGTGGTNTGQYEKNGLTVVGNFDFNFGSASVNAGSGLYEVTLPVTISAGAASGSIIGHGQFFDASASTWIPFELRTVSTTTARMQHAVSSNTSIGSTTPGAGINDKALGSFAYLAA